MAPPVIKKSLRDLIGCGYDEWFYNLDPSTEIYRDGMTKSEWAKSVRYWVVKGGRGSKKSYSVAFWVLINIMAYDKANVLVVRKVADTLADSCYALLEKCAWILGVHDEFRFSKSPLKIIYKRTGQQIIFRGLDDFQKLTSLDVTYGNLCWMWIEEAYQITKKEDFQRIDESIRGKLPEGLFKRIMLTFNPWNKTHWLRTTFFETEDGKPLNDPEIFAHTTNYLMNEWLGQEDYRLYERMKRLNPRQYEVAGLGNWGSPEGLIYNNWEEFEFDFNAVARRDGVVAINGLDFGFSADPTALVCCLYDEAHYEVYIYDELYVRGYTSQMRYDAICKMGHRNSVIYYDSAGALDSAELMELGMNNLIPYNKAGEKNSILNGINFIRSLKIYVHPKCVNTLIEFENYMWYVDKDGNTQPKPQPGSLDHSMDACVRIGTIVDTTYGKTAVENIRVGDYVLTHYGFQKVLNAGKTGHKRIWKLRLNNGMELEATDNHPILTDKGFIRMDSIRYGDKVITWNIPRNMYSTTDTNSIFTTTDIIVRHIIGYIVTSTRKHMGKSQKDTTSIIKTGTRPITVLTTSYACPPRNIISYIPGRKNIRRNRKSIWHNSRINAVNGINPKQDTNGTRHTLTTSDSNRNTRARCVGRSLSRNAVRTDSVPTIANLRGEEKQVSITSNAFVHIAEISSLQTNITVFKPVPAVVLESYAENVWDDVYNLEVENSHTYIANGIVTHNCRYALMGYKQSSGGGYIGSSDDDSWKEQYQYDLMDEEEIKQRKKDVAQSKPKDEPEEEPEDSEEEGGWCFST